MQASDYRSGHMMRLYLTGIMVALLMMLAYATPAWAATFTVTTTNDSGPGSLREAINDANSTPGDDTIEINATGTVQLQSELPALSTNIDINGPGEDQFTVRRDAGGDYRIFTVSGATVSVSGLTATNGDVVNTQAPFGGGISVDDTSTLDLTGVTVSGNTAGLGGGIGNFGGTVRLANSTVNNNSAVAGNNPGLGSGGGILNTENGVLILKGSTVSGNSAEQVGGGIGSGGDPNNVTTAQRAVLTNSTVSGNTADISGGGIATSGDSQLDLNFVTLNDNTAANGSNISLNAVGGSGSNATAEGTIVANGLPSSNCSTTGGTLTSEGNNLEDANSCNFDRPSDKTNTNPLLGPLQDNGGPTRTHALRSGSPAINAVTGGACPSPNTDQRGVKRPQGTRCDIGAFELKIAPPPPPPDNPKPPTPKPPKNPNACTIKGNGGNNILRGTAKRDVICGFGGNDIIRGLGGNDLIKGGAGNDVIRGDSGNDRILGGGGNDILYGGAGRDRLLGQRGNDALFGGNGRDVLLGGPGKNALLGGPGRDVEKGGVTPSKSAKQTKKLINNIFNQVGLR